MVIVRFHLQKEDKLSKDLSLVERLHLDTILISQSCVPYPLQWYIMLQAHLILQNYDDAIEAFQKVLSVEPGNKAAQNQVVQTRNKIKLSREKEKQRYANMFDKLAGKRGQEAAK